MVSAGALSGGVASLRGLARRVQGYQFSPVGSGGEIRLMWLEN
jgi:hypothetical protein